MNKSQASMHIRMGVTYLVLVGFGRAFRAWIGIPSMFLFALLPASEDKHTYK